MTVRRHVATTVTVLGLLAARVAHAKDAQSLFDEGLKAAARGDTRTACALFEESYALAPAGGALLNVAECRFTKGDWVGAFNAFSEARRLAEQQQKPDRVALASTRQSQLEPKVARITLDRALSPERSAWLDGTEFGGLASGPVAVQPGPHTVEIRDRGALVYAEHVTAAVGALTTVAVPAPPRAPVPASLVHAAPESPRAGTDEAPATHRRTLAFVVGGFGVAAGVVGIASGVAAFGKRDAASEAYDRHDAKEAQSLTSEGRTFADVSTVSFVVAGAAIAAAVVLVATAPHDVPRASASRSLPLVLGGSF